MEVVERRAVERLYTSVAVTRRLWDCVIKFIIAGSISFVPMTTCRFPHTLKASRLQRSGLGVQDLGVKGLEVAVLFVHLWFRAEDLGLGFQGWSGSV